MWMSWLDMVPAIPGILSHDWDFSGKYIDGVTDLTASLSFVLCSVVVEARCRTKIVSPCSGCWVEQEPATIVHAGGTKSLDTAWSNFVQMLVDSFMAFISRGCPLVTSPKTKVNIHPSNPAIDNTSHCSTPCRHPNAICSIHNINLSLFVSFIFLFSV